MQAVRLRTPGSIAFVTLFSLTSPVATAGAAEQDGPPTQLDGIRLACGDDDSPALGDNAPRGRPFLALLGAIPLVTYAVATGPHGSELATPADRFATSQLIGAGYVVNPRFRFGVMGIFNEVLTGLPPAADAWQFGGVAPVAIGTFEHFIIGGGPIFGYRSGGQHQSDVGMVVLSGASIPVGRGLALNIVAPTTALFRRRDSVSVGVAIGVAKVF